MIQSSTRYFILCLVLFLSAKAKTQELVKINTVEKKSGSGEIYFVLKSDKDVKHGQYQKYRYGKLSQQGHYTSGEKSGIWTEFQYDGNKARTTTYEHGLKNGPCAEYYPGKGEKVQFNGNFNQDIESGVWQFFNKDGSLHLSFDFADRKLLFFNGERTNTEEWAILQGSDTITAVLDKAPFLIGNENMLPLFISKNIRYPEMALENGIEGTVILGFTVDKTGKCTDVRLVSDIGAGCGKEAMRVFQQTFNFWLPGELNGEPVSVPMYLPVRFKMSK